MGKMGILGGTFDPVHWGHLLLAQRALSQVALEQVIWVPTPCPHYKQAALFEHRWEMLQTAIADHPNFVIALTGNCSTPTYAIQTLIDLKSTYPNIDWYWIVGLDAFLTLPRWYRRQELVTECDWLVAPRLGDKETLQQHFNIEDRAADQTQLICQQVAQQLAAQSLSIRWEILQMPWVGISSSIIRQYCRDRNSIRYLVPEPVRNYIETHNLYLGQQ